MNLDAFVFSKHEAQTAYELYAEAAEKSGLSEDRILAAGYKQIAMGRPVVSLQQVMRAGGLFPDGYPKLAIIRAHHTKIRVTFSPTDRMGQRTGECAFYANSPTIYRVAKADQVIIPVGTFPAWVNPNPDPAIHHGLRNYRADRATIVPIVPAKHRPKYSLHCYHVLWEVEEWELVPPVDPVLLKDIGGGLFAVVAEWDLSPLERAVIGSTRR